MPVPVVVMPAPIIVNRGTDRYSQAKRNDTCARWWSNSHRGIGGIVPASVDHGGTIRRNVDDLGLGGLDDYSLFFHYHRLLRGGLQVARRMGFRPKFLDRIADILLLGEKSISKIRCPLDVFAHHRQHRGKLRQRFHAGVPAFSLQRRIKRIAAETFV